MPWLFAFLLLSHKLHSLSLQVRLTRNQEAEAVKKADATKIKNRDYKRKERANMSMEKKESLSLKAKMSYAKRKTTLVALTSTLDIDIMNLSAIECVQPECDVSVNSGVPVVVVPVVTPPVVATPVVGPVVTPPVVATPAVTAPVVVPVNVPVVNSSCCVTDNECDGTVPLVNSNCGDLISDCTVSSSSTVSEPSPTKAANYSSMHRVKQALPANSKSKKYIIKKLLKSLSQKDKREIVECQAKILGYKKIYKEKGMVNDKIKKRPKVNTTVQ